MTARTKAPTIPPLFKAALKAAGLPLPKVEYPFALEEGRKFRWDFAWPDHTEYSEPVWDDDADKFRWRSRNPALLALEVQGGIWSRGAHGRGTGITRDMEKFSLGAALGWRLLLVEPKDLCSAHNLNLIRMALEAA